MAGCHILSMSGEQCTLAMLPEEVFSGSWVDLNSVELWEFVEVILSSCSHSFGRGRFFGF